MRRGRRGYFVTELRDAGLDEIHRLRQVLEAIAARNALPKLTGEEIERIAPAALERVIAASAGDVASEPAADRTFRLRSSGRRRNLLGPSEQ